MINDQINWDKRFSKLTWNEVYENSPFFDGQRLPTLFSSDGNSIYISSLDLALSTENVDELVEGLETVKSIFDMAKRTNGYYKMAMAQSDFEAVKGLLSKIGADYASHRLVEDSI